MTAPSLYNGNSAYRQDYPYMVEQRIPSTSGRNVPPQTYSSDASTITRPTYPDRRPSNAYTYHPIVIKPEPEEQIAAHLQIPQSVNDSKGSLAEFAAQMTCLFWFEKSGTLRYSEALPQGSIPDRALHPDAVPSIGFTKWVTTILSTTQVGKNVVLLALLFIYRLKQVNPEVSGKKGSEFRLLTIALMLGNKFLDDNTYTNKTWAEVSGISVNEIHIMEVEFLSNMRYALFASEEQWAEWKGKLGRFGSFYEKASRFTSSPAASPTTPISHTISHKLPSPQSSSRFTNGHYTSLPNPLHTIPQLPRSPARNTPGFSMPFERKRSLDTSYDLPPAKRVQPFSASTNVSPEAYTPVSVNTPDSNGTAYSYESSTRLPQLTVPTLPYPNHRTNSQVNSLGLSETRAMSSVYSNTNVTSASALPANVPTLPLPVTGGLASASRAPSQVGSAHTSPTNMYGVSTPTRPGLSPSYFLMNRSSPYRPVRNVNTLLYPPPSGAMQNSIKPIDYQQMHYQPLSKNSTELRAGPMPCLQPDAWHGPVSTPIHQAYHPY
ncbi:hypothetical protein LTR64_003731 [Lithohypha guttulata]|uniref:uncharacterized protein n=1 Tax=Lithohypha guttulata TaxID=1690604 RepID=UPI00315CCD6D